MALTKEEKAQLIRRFQQGSEDTGSPEVQIALLTEEISRLTEHLKQHKHDYHSQHGLIQKVGQRRRLLRYLARTAPERYRKLIAELGLRG